MAALLLALLAGGLLAERPRVARAQEGPGDDGPLPVVGLQQSDIGVLEARGDSLWIGPCLNLTADGGATFARVATEPPLCAGAPRSAISLDMEGRTVLAGLARPAPGGDGSAAAGLLLSRDGGRAFTYRPPPLDTGTEDTVRYGASTLPALPVVTPEGSAPFAVDYVDSTRALWVAAGASGLRRSTDGGQTFERIVLPPDSLGAISPAESYQFALRPKGEDPPGPGFFNHVVNSVLVDAAGTVWAGTDAGVNRSRPGDVQVFEQPGGGARFTDRAWQRFGPGNTGGPDRPGDGLTGSAVVRISEQPLAGRRNAVWMVTRAGRFSGGRPGVTYTRDGGASFRQTLRGEIIYDFAFRGERAYAAGARGLFISEGRTDTSYAWRLADDFPGAGFPEAAVATRRPVFSVATTEEALWAGTGDGLLKSTDGGATWEVFRTRVPTDPDEPTEAVPEAETYAYPNPFSPSAAPSGVVRIVIEAEEADAATVRLYNFAMEPVRELTGDCDAGGRAPGALGSSIQRCEVAWDGTGAGGARVANAVYFYEIEAGDETARGKIIVLE